jgi:tetratricopeptide (TPR) repeat protein
MKKLWYFMPTAIFLSLLISSINLGLAVTAQQTSSFSQLTLDLAISKEKFVQLEPIPLNLRLSNKTNQPIVGHSAIDFSYNLIELFVFYNGEKREITKSDRIIDGVAKAKIIRPRESYSSKELINLDLDQTFHEPGVYQIQAVLHDIDGKQEVKSNLVAVRILAPQGADAQAFSYIKSNGKPPYTFTSGLELHSSEQAQNVLKIFVFSFRDTVYGDYAALDLGVLAFHKGQYEQAIEHLQVLSDNSTFAFADRALSYLALAHDKLHNLEKARYYFGMLKTRYPENEYTKKTALSISREATMYP